MTAEPNSTSVAIEPFGRAQVPVRFHTAGRREGKSICVTLDFGGRSLRHTIPVRYVPPVERLPEGLSLCSVWEAERLSHNTGAAVNDPEAFGGKAWQAVPGKHPGKTHSAWGPYEELPPGRYTVAFRLKVEGQGDAPLAQTRRVQLLARHRRARLQRMPNEHYGPPTSPCRDVTRTTGSISSMVGPVRWNIASGGPEASPLSVDRIVVFRKP